MFLSYPVHCFKVGGSGGEVSTKPPLSPQARLDSPSLLDPVQNTRFDKAFPMYGKFHAAWVDPVSMLIWM